MDELWKVKAVSRTFSAIAALLSLSDGSLCTTVAAIGPLCKRS